MFDCEYGSRVPVILKFLPEKFGSTVTIALLVPLYNTRFTVAEIKIPCTLMDRYTFPLFSCLTCTLDAEPCTVMPPNPLGPG